MSESLPPIPPNGSQLDYLVRAVTWLTAESISHTEKLELIMATEAENEALLARLESSLSSARGAITTQIQQLRDLVEQTAANKPLTEAQRTRLTGIADALDAETTRLGADDTTG